MGSVLIGKTVLIGLTYLHPEGERLEQKHGTIIAVDGHNGVEIRLEGAETGSLFYLPPIWTPSTRPRPENTGWPPPATWLSIRTM